MAGRWLEISIHGPIYTGQHSKPRTMATSAPIPTHHPDRFSGRGKNYTVESDSHRTPWRKIAVIENEFGEAGIDNEILVQNKEEQIVEMNNGCICCTVRGDLVKILGDLAKKRAHGKLKFDRVIIETTGMADPGPVAQTFFMDDEIHDAYLLDAVVTVVDAKHAMQQLTDNNTAREQIGFADRILISKSDLVAQEETEALIARLKNMNPRASYKKCTSAKPTSRKSWTCAVSI